MVENNQQPLVSVAVIAYNSSATVLETLESIYNQTYPNIELIISDDCSTDNTLDVCRKWLCSHEQRFSSTRIIVSGANTGVTGNCQRVWESCGTEWLKFIAADDVLFPNCIDDNMNFVAQHIDAQCVFSKVEVIGIPKEDGELFCKSRYDYSFFEMSPKEQYEKILPWCSIPIVTAFLNNKNLREIGLNFDTRIPMLEDRPFYLNAIAAGVRFDLLDKQTVGYRVHPNSLCNVPILSPKFYESTQLTNFFYYFAYYYQKDPDSAIREIVSREMRVYNEYYNLKMDSLTKSYKIYKCLSHPSRIFKRIKKCFIKNN